MYYLFVIATTVLLPVASILIEYVSRPDADLLLLLGKWFVFWGIGVCLLTAVLAQAIRPSTTASGIFAIGDPNAQKIVAELGYANISIGTIGLLSLAVGRWTTSAGVAGGMFLGIAGFKHIMNAGRNGKQTFAMWTDLFVFAMVTVYLASVASR